MVKDGIEIPQQNICRYYPSVNGGKLVKIMPPLVKGGDERRLGIDTEWDVSTCNNVSDSSGIFIMTITSVKQKSLLTQ